MKKLFLTVRGPLLLLLVCVAPLALAATVGAQPPAAMWTQAPGWSRARVVGTTALDEAVPIAVDDQGRAYLLLAQPAPGAHRPQVVALARDGAVAWEHTFEAAPARISSPQIVWDGQGLALFWLSGRRLYAARLDPGGQVGAAPAPVAAGQVASYAVAVAAGGGSLWYAGDAAAPGVFAAPLADPAQAVRVAETGRAPAARYGADGALHAVWLAGAGDSASIVYASFADGVPRAAEPQQVAETGGPIDGGAPSLGVDRERVTVIWTTRATSGMNAGQHFSQYVSFPLGQPAGAPAPRPLTVPGSADLAYEQLPDAVIAAGPRAQLRADAATLGIPPASMSVDPSGGPEVALAAEVAPSYRAGERPVQVGVLFFRGGQPASYQLLTFSPTGSFTPALTGSGGALYATWRQVRPAGSAVFVASTAPDVVRAFDALSADDGARMLNDTVFGMLAGLIVSPFTLFLWLVPPLAVLLPTWFLRRHDTRITQWGTALSLALAAAAFWAAKLTLAGTALQHVPFSAWVPLIPGWLALPLQIGVPLLIAAAALYAAWSLSYARGRPSAALFALIYAAVDGLGTMAVYGEHLTRQ